MHKMRKLKKEELNTKQTDICSKLPPSLQQPVACAKYIGVSSWLAALSIESHEFALHKGTFKDALAVSYGWESINLSAVCACGSRFNPGHALYAKKAGFQSPATTKSATSQRDCNTKLKWSQSFIPLQQIATACKCKP